MPWSFLVIKGQASTNCTKLHGNALVELAPTIETVIRVPLQDMWDGRRRH
jgi:hypothetical protein